MEARSIVGKVLRVVGALLAIVVLVLVGIAVFARGPGGTTVPAGHRRNEARYLTMRDGVRIAIDVWYPAGLAAGAKVPALIRSTRYVRTMALGPLGRLLATFGQMTWTSRDVVSLNQAGYTVLLVDARGSGASFGSRDAEWTPEEVADMGEVVDWIVAQPWSNGRVGGYGVSYEGNTAELLAASDRPAVKAVAPWFDDYDPIFTQAMAGGAFAKPFLDAWGGGNNATDANDLCTAAGVTGFKCWLQGLFVTGTKPVDGDSGRALLARAVAGHKANYDVSSTVGDMVYPRDSLLPNGKPYRFVAPFWPNVRSVAERNRVAMMVRLGWMDGGTMNTGLGRYLTQSNPMMIEVGPWSHGGGHNVDPFVPPDTPTEPSQAEQFQQMITFFDGYLKADGDKPIGRTIRYYTMNDGRWSTATTWPPEGTQVARWYAGPNGSLTRDRSAADSASDRYAVDFTTSTGHPSRWDTQLGGGDVIYPDRAEEDKKLLTYTSEPLAADLEITGAPVVDLEIASTAADGLFIAYLEDVAPSGRVTYLTEGLLRGLHRKISTAPPPYHEFGPYHSFTSADGAPLVPNEPTSISFALYSTSVRLKAGHRIRLAIAGHDQAAFARIPKEGNPALTVFRDRTRATWIELPTRPAQ